MTSGAITSPLRPTNGPEAAPVLRPVEELLFNHELSLLKFHGRVLEEALDRSQPLLERLKFLAIFSSNINEYFMLRMPALKEEAVKNTLELTRDRLSAIQQLRAVREELRPVLAGHMRCLTEEVLPQLEAEAIVIARYDSLSEIERQQLDAYFTEIVFPILIPLTVDPVHPFPYIPSLSLNVGLMIEQTGEPEKETAARQGKTCFAYVKVPQNIPRVIPLGESGSKFILLEDLIEAKLPALFSGKRIGGSHLFRLTRDADLDIREEEVSNLLSEMEEQLPRRRFGTPVRLEVSSSMPTEMVDYLMRSIGLTPDDVYVVEGPVNVADLIALYGVDRPDLKYRRLKAVVPARLKQRKSIFEIIKEQDVLLHHPYNPYSTVTGFIQAAALDPEVLAIKICLYRMGQDSPIGRALIEASRRGKQVAAVIELKARFDEENNIEWAKRLEQAGVHVVYGLLGLKTHAKIALVIRREGGKLRRYAHIATGNYNPTTSTVYTDIGILTADEEIGADVTDIFNHLTAESRQEKYRRLLVSPTHLRESMVKLIEREAEHARAGRPARIIVKINRLTDTGIICALYRASQAGVPIDLIVRSTCTLRPSLPGLSETINVRSIVGRFLEHSRIYYFANGGKEEIYIGSSDWMPRNLDRRVEVVIPVRDPQLGRYLIDVVLPAYLRDNVRARRLLPDGTYERIPIASGEEKFDSQLYFESAPGASFSLS